MPMAVVANSTEQAKFGCATVSDSYQQREQRDVVLGVRARLRGACGRL
jgi:hypothetical protein